MADGSRLSETVALLRHLADAVERGRLADPELSRLADAVAGAAACARRNAAIRRIGEILDPQGFERPHPLAGRVAAALAAFQDSGAWTEIQRGRRPGTSLEAACSAALSCPGPRDQRRLFDILRHGRMD